MQSQSVSRALQEMHWPQATKALVPPWQRREEVLKLKRFDVLLEEDVSGYKGELSDLICNAPALYRLMTRLLDDPALPKDMSQLVIAAIAYFILPEDVIPEDKYGPRGYVDDLFLCAFVADQVMKQTGSEDILSRNWEGKTPIVSLIKNILSRENELLGNQKDKIMDYIGYEQLGSLARPNNID